MHAKNVVWILGAGFSVPLGGPMLKDLLSLEKRTDLDAWDALKNAGMVIDNLYYLYHYGRRFEGAEAIKPPSGKVFGERLWNDAEDFLDQLDGATPAFKQRAASILQRRYLNGGGGEVDQPDGFFEAIRLEAKRRVAAECCHFLEGANVATERWSAHVRWASRLCGHDTVITFNYDRAIELLSSARGVDYLADDCVMTPGDGYGDKVRWLRGNKRPRVLKLHGSVDWAIQDSKCLRMENATYALSCDNAELAIATPGAGKSGMANSALRRLWSDATDSLNKADAIVFVGYRFPETDAQAREALLEAIRENTTSNPLTIHIVLGPERSKDVNRLEHLLMYQCNRAGRVTQGNGLRYSVEVHPLWSQDFFSVFDHDEL